MAEMPHELSTACEHRDLSRTVHELRLELADARDQQTAANEILRVISISPTNPQPVFDAIAESAVRVCGGLLGGVYRFDGKLIHFVAHHNWTAEGLSAVGRVYPRPLSRETQVATAILDRTVVHVPDFDDPDVPAQSLTLARALGYRSILVVPISHHGAPIGAIAVARAETGPFSESQINMLKTFADQAVIAIENTRLFEAEQASKHELQESLEYQTAMSSVLAVISRSPTDVQPVLDTIARIASDLCSANDVVISLRENDQLRMTAHYGPIPIDINARRPIGRDWVSGRAVTDRRPAHVRDLLHAGDEFPLGREIAERFGHRTTLGIPLLRSSEAIGCLLLRRKVVEPFTDKQIELLKTFADQAVIAIENARLFQAEQTRTRELQVRTRELGASLQQQTATADVLKVISRSTFDLQAVLDALLEYATRLCDAESGLIWRFDGEVFRAAAAYGVRQELVAFWGQHPIRPGRGSVTGRAALERRAVQIPDALADPEYHLAQSQQLGGYRTLLGVPMLRGDVLVGVFGLQRYQVQPFTDKQIDLVTTFADQAVIAIENVRLFEEVQAKTRELTRSVAELEALGAVAQTVSSTLDLKIVLARILEHACAMSDSGGGAIYGFDKVSGHFVLEAGHNMIEEHIAAVREHPIRLGESLIGQCANGRQATQIDDLMATPAHPLYEIHLKAGVRALLAVPLLNQDEVIGALIVRRTRAGLFTPETVGLLQAFANQSAIALENARLFEEIAQKSRELEIASQHKSQFVANMSHELRTPLAAVLGYAELMQEGFYGPLPEKSRDALTRIRSNGKHLLGLINTVLDVAKLESGQFTLNMAEYVIESVIETVRSATESLAQNKKLALKTEVAKSLPVGLGDEQRLTQVLLNLVGNAIKFTDAGEVSITAGARNGHFAVSVTDTGPGIPEDQQDRIFEQFHQVDSSNTKAKGGTGLGLAIAKQIVEMHGGRIWVESTLGKGSTFQMELPTRAQMHKRTP
jgi:signal transduction histidine kinase